MKGATTDVVFCANNPGAGRTGTRAAEYNFAAPQPPLYCSRSSLLSPPLLPICLANVYRPLALGRYSTLSALFFLLFSQYTASLKPPWIYSPLGPTRHKQPQRYSAATDVSYRHDTQTPNTNTVQCRTHSDGNNWLRYNRQSSSATILNTTHFFYDPTHTHPRSLHTHPVIHTVIHNERQVPHYMNS